MDDNRNTGEPFPFEELIREAPRNAREAFEERSAAFEAGDLVRLMREKAGLTQRELAQRISTSQSHLSEVERGNGLQGPTFSMLRKVAAACQINLKIELAPAEITERLDDISPEHRQIFAAAAAVPLERASQALIAAREKALSILSIAYIDQILKAPQTDAVRQYAQWLFFANRF
jgi:transcriptional regulator with XRE-family HTH domain